MTNMFQSLDFFVLSCIFLTAESQQGQILPPQNVSLQWISGFKLQLSWAPPQQLPEHCSYLVKTHNRRFPDVKSQTYQLYTVMEGGSLQLTVDTVCNGKHSKLFDVNKTYPELVKDFWCHIHAAKQTHCSWLPDRHAADLRFFYRLLDNSGSVSVNDKSDPLSIRECSSYSYTGGVRTGCDLEADIHHEIHILFNGTVNNTLARNSFMRKRTNVRPPPLKWTVTKNGDKFNIAWTPPDVKAHWTIILRYTECNDEKIRKYSAGETSDVLDAVSHCPYRMAIKAETDRGETPWSEEKYFDVDTDLWLYAAIIIPLMFAGLAVLISVCCRKNKENIFPKVPQPRDLLSDISDNNNKNSVRNLYIPAEEEHHCKITLVSDPHNNMLDF